MYIEEDDIIELMLQNKQAKILPRNSQTFSLFEVTCKNYGIESPFKVDIVTDNIIWSMPPEYKQIDIVINSSSLKRSKIKETIEKINLYKNSKKISDQVIDEICTDMDLKKNDEIIDILLSKNEKNINELISNMSNYEKNFIGNFICGF